MISSTITEPWKGHKNYYIIFVKLCAILHNFWEIPQNFYFCEILQNCIPPPIHVPPRAPYTIGLDVQYDKTRFSQNNVQVYSQLQNDHQPLWNEAQNNVNEQYSEWNQGVILIFLC